MLSGIEIFADLTSQDLHKIAAMLHIRTYLPREIIVQQGAPGVGLYIIQSGSAAVQLETSDGRVLHLATLGERQFFGEMSLLDGAPRAASVMALERVYALGFFRADLMGLLDHAPRLGFQIIWRVSRIMAQRLCGTLKDFREVSRQLRLLTGHNLPQNI
jgi:CRP-like cAMP-binding protein